MERSRRAGDRIRKPGLSLVYGMNAYKILKDGAYSFWWFRQICVLVPEIGQFWDLPVDLPLRISRRLIMRYHEYMLPFFPILMLRSFLGLGRREKTEMLETTGNRPENVSPWNRWNLSKRRTFRPRFNGSLVIGGGGAQTQPVCFLIF